MTRETKIGLLVGLSFIIVVGILLSDHIADSNRPPQALLSDVGNNVRNSVAIPQPAIAQNAPLANNSIAPAVAVAGPTAPVPTHEELKQAATPAVVAPAPADNVVVGIGPGESVKSLTPNPAPADIAQTPAPNQTTMPLAATDQPAASDSSNDDSAAATPIKLSDSADTSDTAKVLKQYKVEKGDTLGKIAKHFYGTSSHAAVAAILAANPQLKGNAARLGVGKTYAIPDFGKTSATPAAGSGATVASVDTNTMAGNPATRPSSETLAKTRVHSPGGTYTVKAGDSLWKIASSQLGSARQVKEIEELNPGVLHHGQLKIGTVLKMPAKTVAAAD